MFFFYKINLLQFKDYEKYKLKKYKLDCLNFSWLDLDANFQSKISEINEYWF